MVAATALKSAALSSWNMGHDMKRCTVWSAVASRKPHRHRRRADDPAASAVVEAGRFRQKSTVLSLPATM